MNLWADRQLPLARMRRTRFAPSNHLTPTGKTLPEGLPPNRSPRFRRACVQLAPPARKHRGLPGQLRLAAPGALPRVSLARRHQHLMQMTAGLTLVLEYRHDAPYQQAPVFHQDSAGHPTHASLWAQGERYSLAAHPGGVTGQSRNYTGLAIAFEAWHRLGPRSTRHSAALSHPMR